MGFVSSDKSNYAVGNKFLFFYNFAHHFFPKIPIIFFKGIREYKQIGVII